MGRRTGSRPQRWGWRRLPRRETSLRGHRQHRGGGGGKHPPFSLPLTPTGRAGASPRRRRRGGPGSRARVRWTPARPHSHRTRWAPGPAGKRSAPRSGRARPAVGAGGSRARRGSEPTPRPPRGRAPRAAPDPPPPSPPLSGPAAAAGAFQRGGVLRRLPYWPAAEGGRTNQKPLCRGWEGGRGEEALTARARAARGCGVGLPRGGITRAARGGVQPALGAGAASARARLWPLGPAGGRVEAAVP